MKKGFERTGRRFLPLVLAAVMALTPVAAAAGTYGDEIFSKSQEIAENTVLKNTVFWNTVSGDKLTENYLEYRPGTVQALPTYGHDVYGAATIARAAELAKAEGNHVIGAINGDFFTMSNGVSFGTVIRDGIVRTSESPSYETVGFLEDGTAFIGKIGMNIGLKNLSSAVTIGNSHLNKAMTASAGLILYTEDYNVSTEAKIPTYNVVLTPVEEAYTPDTVLSPEQEDSSPDMSEENGDEQTASEEPVTAADFDGLRLNHTYQFKASPVQEAEGVFTIPAGSLVLSIAKDSPYTTTKGLVSGMQAGCIIEAAITASGDSRWEDVSMAIGGHERLLTNGTHMAADIKDNATGSSPLNRNPRTALGIKADGTVVLYTLDGRQSGYSIGTTLYQLGYRMLELGCVDAINLDGGGSTVLQAQMLGENALTTINSPSEGSIRKCGNYILLVNTASATGIPTRLAFSSPVSWMLKGASLKFTPLAADENYYAAALPSDLEFSVTGGIGTIGEEGMFKAEAAGDGAVVVSSEDCEDGFSQVKVVETPSGITVQNESSGAAVTSLTLAYEDTINLKAGSQYNHMDLLSDDSCYTWSVSEEIGTIDGAGNLTVTSLSDKSGYVTVAAGEKTVQIPVSVKGMTQPFVDMNGHWASQYTTYLYSAGIINGSSSEAGLQYKPDNNMTRAEFAVILSNWLTDSTEQYSGTELPFADRDQIPSWAMEAVQAAYSLGIVKGSAVGDQLYFNWDQPISRQEAMTMIGRTMEISETAEELTFIDSADVADWALPYVKTLISMGAVSGMPDGSLSPNAFLTRAQVAKIIACLAE